jgi:hypothetical protein
MPGAGGRGVELVETMTADSLELAAYGPDEDEICAVEDAANRLRLKACGLPELDMRSTRG